MTLRALALAALAVPVSAQAGALSPWGLQTTGGETWFTPYVFVDNSSVSTSPYLSVGLGKRVDIIGGFGIGWSNGLQIGAVEAMPRIFVHENVGLVVRVGSVPGAAQLEVGPEVHAAWTAGRFAFTANVGWRPTVGEDGGLGSAFGVFAPEIFVSDAVSLFVEVNPSLDLTDPTAPALTVVPGFSAAIGDHSFAVGAMMPTDDPTAFTVGAWYSVRVGRAGERTLDTAADEAEDDTTSDATADASD